MNKETKPTRNIKEGDYVVMHTCGEAEHYHGKLWKCKTDSFKDINKHEVVFLEEFSGYFYCKYLQKVHLLEPHKEPVEEERELKKGDKVIYTDEITKEEIKGTISFISVFCGSTVYFIDSLPDTYINEESLRFQEPTKEKLNPIKPDEQVALNKLKLQIEAYSEGEIAYILPDLVRPHTIKLRRMAQNLVNAMEARQEKPEGEE